MLTHFLSPLCHMSFHRLVTAVCSFAATRDRKMQFLPEVALGDRHKKTETHARHFLDKVATSCNTSTCRYVTSPPPDSLSSCASSKFAATHLCTTRKKKMKGTQMLVACLEPDGLSEEGAAMPWSAAPTSRHIHTELCKQ